MRSALRRRYYCDHCNKGSGSPSAMKRHEKGCTKNPQRRCGMCLVYGRVNRSPSDLLRVLNEQGFEALKEATEDCPACILSALRLLPYDLPSEDGPGGMVGPDDGRHEWRFQDAKRDWWEAAREWEQSRYEQGIPMPSDSYWMS